MQLPLETRDENGRLASQVAKQVEGSITSRYLYGPEAITPVAEVDSQGNATARFVYGTRGHVPDYIVKSSNTYRVITDQLGSVRLVVDSATGAIAQELAYDEFGRVTQDTNPGFQPFGFAGGLYDRDTGLVHFGEREYDAKLGRFTSVDPIGFAGGQLNLHAYVLNDPVNIVDPSGLDPVNDVGQAAMCFGDTVTLGASAKVREWLGMGNVKDKCSKWCGAGTAAAALFPGPGGKARLVNGVGRSVGGGRRVVPVAGTPGFRTYHSPTHPFGPPGPDWVWRGGKKGSWFNPNTGGSIHPDPSHGPPHGPHFDVKRDRYDPGARVYPTTGLVEPK